MASLVLSVVYATDKRRKRRLYGSALCSVRAGVLGLQRVGDAGVNAILLSQALAFAMPGKSNVGGAYLGGDFEWRTASHVPVFATGEYFTRSDSSSTVSGQGRRTGCVLSPAAWKPPSAVQLFCVPRVCASVKLCRASARPHIRSLLPIGCVPATEAMGQHRT
jgi:hypothetical protein